MKLPKGVLPKLIYFACLALQLAIVRWGAMNGYSIWIILLVCAMLYLALDFYLVYLDPTYDEE